MSQDSYDYTNKSDITLIIRIVGETESKIGYLDAEGFIYRLRWDQSIRVGRISPDRRVFRTTRYDERELGSFTEAGVIRSHGLFEGGELGWVEADGSVVQAGLIFGEKEVGRVVGVAPVAAGAALLLLFLVDENEEKHRADR